MTGEFDPNWEHGHVLRHGNNFTIFEKTDHGWFGKYEDNEGVERAAKWGPYAGTLVSSISSAEEFRYSLINAPAPKRTFKRWYVDLEYRSGTKVGTSFQTHEEAVKFVKGVRGAKVLAIHEHETVEGTGLDDSDLQNMHSAPEPEEPKTVKVGFWLNVYDDGSTGDVADTRDEADEAEAELRYCDRIACIHIERDVKVGEGLDG